MPAAVAAWAAFLRQLGLDSQSVDELLKYRPPEAFLEERWVRLEFMRAFVRLSAAQRSYRSLLPMLFDLLLKLPLDLFIKQESIFVPDSPADQDWRALQSALRGSNHVDDLPRLAAALRDFPSRGHWLEFCYRVLELLACYGQSTAKDWRNWRTEGLDGMRALYACVLAYERRGHPQDRVVEGAREIMGSTLPPQDRDPLNARREWFADTRAWLTTFQPRKMGAAVPSDHWRKPVERFWQHLQRVLLHLCDKELGYLRLVVRPFLRLQGPLRPGRDRRVILSLRVEPEGEPRWSGVSVCLDASGAAGLQQPGRVREELRFVEYPAEYADRDLMLWGYVEPGQHSVIMQASLSATGAEPFQEEWRFPVEWTSSEDRASPAVWGPGWIDWSYRRLRDALIEGNQDTVTWLVFDEQLARHEVLANWDAQFPHARLDLDATLGLQGRGHGLWIERMTDEIDQRLREPGLKSRRTRRPVLLLGPADELFKQLCDESQPQHLPKWLSYLTEYAERGSGARLAILVSSLDAAFLRRRGLTRFREIPMHLILHRELRSVEPQDSASYAEFVKLVGQELPPHQLGFFDRVVGRLGADLRLISEWIGWLKHQCGDTELERFCEEPAVVELFRRELASLTALDYLMVVAGTTTKTRLERQRVQAGQVAAEDYYSSTERYQRKRLQTAGQPFTRVTLHRIASDPASPPNLRVEGFGSTGTPVESVAAVMQVVTSLGPKQRESRLRRLADLGFGSWVRGIFRTGSPYREYLATLHDRHSTAGVVQRINSAYQALVGADRWLTEALGPEDLRGWKAQELMSFMPQARPVDVGTLLRLAALWRDPSSTAEVDSALGALFAPYPLRRPDEAERFAWAELEARGCVVYRLYREAPTAPTDAVVWLGQNGTVDTETLSRAALSAARGGPKFPLLALGPGVEDLGPDVARRVAYLRFADLREAACRGDLLKESLRKVRSHLGLKLLSPFQTSGALPPGSPLFVGREEERDFIQANIRSKSILIVGARRIGKTSLLNYVYHWAGQQPDLQPIRIDLQGAGSVPEFCSRLRASLRADHPGLLSAEGESRGSNDAFVLLKETIDVIDKNGKRAIFLLNEVDRIAENCPDLINTWKGIHEHTQARFVMVGYSVIGDLGNVSKALFQFTEGDRYDGRALAPTTLKPQPAREILDLLEREPLALRWRDIDERERCHGELLDRSYRIPWVLQRYAVELVERLEERRSDTLSYDDVRAVITQRGGEVWSYFDGIDYDKLGHPGTAEALRRGFQLVLFALVRWRYFLGGARAPIRDPRLRSLQALDAGLSFSEAEAYEIVQRTLADLLHGRKEQQYFERWFRKLDLKRVFRLLTLTLVLESLPGNTQRYGFLLNMLPLEIWRRYHRQDPTLDTKIVELAIEFLRYSRHTRVDRGRGT